MKNDLTCAVVRDLLPSYVEKLTSKETGQAVERHLAACPDCSARRIAMAGPENAAKLEEEAREVNYLKRVKRKNRLRVALAALCTALLILGGLAAKIFLIGVPIQPQTYALRCYVDEENVLHLVIDCVDSGRAYYGWETETEDGAVKIFGRAVTVSPVHNEGWGRLLISLDGVNEVWLCGEIVWQDGMIISRKYLEMLASKTPYAGDAAAVGAVADALGIRESLNTEYTMELTTAREPFRWTLNFTGRRTGVAADVGMRAEYAPLMLALVDNLDEVGWTYQGEDGSLRRGVLTLEEANARLSELTALCNQEEGTDWIALNSVKDYAGTPADFARLCRLANRDAERLWGTLSR